MAMTQTYLKEILSQKFNFDKWKENVPRSKKIFKCLKKLAKDMV